jgi:hypothetical protein
MILIVQTGAAGEVCASWNVRRLPQPVSSREHCCWLLIGLLLLGKEALADLLRYSI